MNLSKLVLAGFSFLLASPTHAQSTHDVEKYIVQKVEACGPKTTQRKGTTVVETASTQTLRIEGEQITFLARQVALVRSGVPPEERLGTVTSLMRSSVALTNLAAKAIGTGPIVFVPCKSAACVSFDRQVISIVKARPSVTDDVLRSAVGGALSEKHGGLYINTCEEDPGSSFAKHFNLLLQR